VAATRIEVENLKPFIRELRTAGSAFPREMRAASKEGADLVADATRASFSSRAGSAPMAAASVKALAQQRGAAVRIGGDRTVGGQVALGNEFGGGKFGPGNPTPAGGHTTQFPEFRRGGYSLFPSVRAKQDEVIERYAAAIDRIAARAFPS